MMRASKDTSPSELYISVDIEASGPIPEKYSMLSLGACLVDDLNSHFYIELKPINENFEPRALEVCNLSMKELEINGAEAVDAMCRFSDWLRDVKDRRKMRHMIFVGLNASFDWQFVNWYFHRYLGENPFGINVIDIKSFYMGLRGKPWSTASSTQISEWLDTHQVNKHNALSDALYQAKIFAELMVLAVSHEND